MNVLLCANAHLYDALCADRRGALMLAGVLFDPISEEEAALDCPLWHGLSVARMCFPTLYAQAVLAWQAGTPYAALESLLCDGISTYGIPIDDLDMLAYGIPLPAYGVSEEEPFHDTARDIMRLFDVDHPYEGTETMWTTVRVLCLSLETVTTPQATWFHALLSWLWGVSGNTCVDSDPETLAEYEPLAWDADNIAFACDLIAEAETHMENVARAIEHIQRTPDILTQLCANLSRIHLPQKERCVRNDNDLRHFARRCQLDWSTLVGSTCDTSPTGAIVLPLWHLAQAQNRAWLQRIPH